MGLRQGFSIILLVWLISSHILKISFLTWIILEIAMKMTLKLGFGRQPQDNSNFFLIFFLSRLISSWKPKINLSSLLNSWDSCEEDLEIMILKFFEDCFGIPLTLPTNVRKQVYLNSCYFTTILGGRPGGT